MKVFRWILIVLLIVAGLVLIVPAFLPSSVTLTAETDIAVGPEEVFHSAALYLNREKWDPWLQMDPEAEVKISSNENYVGSSYSWEGEKIGSGSMKVEEVEFGKYIRSSIWFGEDPEPSTVEWNIVKTDSGAHVTWSYIADGNYPFGRLMLMMISRSMKSSFESGLADLKEMLESDPPKLYKISEIKLDMFPEMSSLVIPVEGTIDEITARYGKLYIDLFNEAYNQKLEMAGSPFAYYFDFDQELRSAKALVGIHTMVLGKSSGEIEARVFRAQKAVVTVFTGRYEYIQELYDTVTGYAEENEVELDGSVFEVYKKTMMESDNPMEWVTVLSFPIK